ncbi:transcript variant X1, partial [Nothobranchius furzeri]
QLQEDLLKKRAEKTSGCARLVKNVLLFIELLTTFLLFKGGVLIYAEHCNKPVIGHFGHAVILPTTGQGWSRLPRCDLKGIIPSSDACTHSQGLPAVFGLLLCSQINPCTMTSVTIVDWVRELNSVRMFDVWIIR